MNSKKNNKNSPVSDSVMPQSPMSKVEVKFYSDTKSNPNNKNTKDINPNR